MLNSVDRRRAGGRPNDPSVHRVRPDAMGGPAPQVVNLSTRRPPTPPSCSGTPTPSASGTTRCCARGVPAWPVPHGRRLGRTRRSRPNAQRSWSTLRARPDTTLWCLGTTIAAHPDTRREGLCSPSSPGCRDERMLASSTAAPVTHDRARLDDRRRGAQRSRGAQHHRRRCCRRRRGASPPAQPTFDLHRTGRRCAEHPERAVPPAEAQPARPGGTGSLGSPRTRRPHGNRPTWGTAATNERRASQAEIIGAPYVPRPPSSKQPPSQALVNTEESDAPDGRAPTRTVPRQRRGSLLPQQISLDAAVELTSTVAQAWWHSSSVHGRAPTAVIRRDMERRAAAIRLDPADIAPPRPPDARRDPTDAIGEEVFVGGHWLCRSSFRPHHSAVCGLGVAARGAHDEPQPTEPAGRPRGTSRRPAGRRRSGSKDFTEGTAPVPVDTTSLPRDDPAHMPDQLFDADPYAAEPDPSDTSWMDASDFDSC